MHHFHQSHHGDGLRVMVKDDLREVLRIEASSFADPWSERDFIEHLEHRDSVALLVEQRGLIAGYEVFAIRGSWIQLHACVVRPEFRRRGLGSSLVAQLVRQSASHDPGGVLVKVPERNLGAQLFFRHCGFRAERILPAFLLADQDVYLMKYAAPEWASPSFELDGSEDELISLWEVKHGCPLRAASVTGTRRGC